MSHHGNEDLRETIREMLLEDPEFIHDLIMGKYGYGDAQAAKVEAKIEKLIQSS